MYVYADNAATTKLSERAFKKMEKCFFEIYGNPSSIHKEGKAAKQIIESARKDIGECINCEADKIYFTSGGTESDNWAAKIAEEIGYKRGKRHIISTAIEHHAVGNSLKSLEKKGFEITYIKPGKNGIINVADFEKAIRPDTFFASVMYANNVIGTIQPIKEIGMICRKRAIIFHTDAVQAVGHIPIDVKRDYIDILSASAHKFHGPKGCGFLYCRNKSDMTVFMNGGGHESGYRAGTENVPGIAGMAEALKESMENMGEDINYINSLKKIIEGAVLKIEDSKINGDMKKRLPGNINVSFKGVSGDSLLRMLDMEGVFVSAGSACSASSSKPNFVIIAMGGGEEEALSSLRITLSAYNTKEEVLYIAEKLKNAVERLRQMSSIS